MYLKRKDLQVKFNIIGNNNEIMLFRKRGDFNYGSGYCGNISLKRGKAIFKEKPYSTIDELNNALMDWEKSLEWPVDTYCPMYRDVYRISSRLCWYLTEKMGFELNHEDWEEFYIRRVGEDTCIKFSIKDKDDGVELFTHYDKYLMKKQVKSENDGIAFFDSIISCYVLEKASDIVSILGVCKNEIVTQIDTYVKDNSILGVKKTDFKGLMISKLEKQLELLKTM